MGSRGLGLVVRPIVPKEYVGCRPIHADTLETKPRCIFGKLWGQFVEERDIYFDDFLPDTYRGTQPQNLTVVMQQNARLMP